ncbi:hydantoinase B/oxoprolinase family protein [Variovorax sp. NFACC27]|uniref:hydantoinase B/oxoprolinase family protein n=1 Tax=unclassified Variovorax TaxID=663243 RepID=UPI000897C652|nr:N-methylhydantoinase B [Variovorax sp. NFACC28]SEG09857.1 N-methylhydantoinase B [Variovorax sp. NFACC29]SFC04144.1 N-methylhydantoinase B [Variovorax sp. NFACC26]SFF77425.1 N-methylhydantoinase B [Variovorax sp. NFACC27]
MPIENTQLQVLANHCMAAAESMGYTLMRTAYSSFVKETEDFSAQLLTPSGQTFASPRTLGATWYTGLDYGPVIKLFDDYREGDIYITNDPYSGFVSTHTPDVHLWKPVFHSGRLVCFLGNHIHNTDMGGAVPASLSRALTEVHQEGVRIPPMLLARDGVIDPKILQILETNVRAPELNRGDLNAQIACLNTGERKVHEIVDRFGIDEFVEGTEQLLDYAEQQTRSLIQTMPDGEYFFSEYADEDSPNGFPCRIAITLRIRGDELELDFTGSDPQVASALNVPTGGNPRHAVITVGLIYVLHSLAPLNVLNAGTVRPCNGILPEGTIVNPRHPAAVGMRSLTSAVLQACTFGLFSQVLPQLLPACPAGGSSNLNVKTISADGRPVLSSIGPCGGGAGGGPERDGVEGCGANSAFLKNTPVEINEAEVPIEILRYGLVSDTGGAGERRGGNAATLEFRVLSPNAVVTARNRNRTDIAAWGVLGGHAGANSRFTKNPDTPQAVELRNMDVVPCAPGDVIRVQGPGGGGHGDPFRRPVDAVLHDVRCGFVSPERARSDYGVVVAPAMQLDVHATHALRSDRQGPSAGHFHFGPGRSRFESVWTPQRYKAFAAIARAVPVSWAHYVKHHLFTVLKDNVAPVDGGAADVYRVYRDLRAQFPTLPEVVA